MVELTQASRQWASRPNDERYLNLVTMQKALHANRVNSKEVPFALNQLTALAKGADLQVTLDPHGRHGANMTNWAYNQLCATVKAPASFISELSAPLAASVLNERIQLAGAANGNKQVMAYLNGSSGLSPTLQAVTSPSYGRIYCDDITSMLIDRFGDGRTGDFVVPGEFGKAVPVTKANTTLYASDRDMFVFLADEKHRIIIPGKDGERDNDLARGFFIWNSEVGARTFGISTFLFRYVCCNRIVWGAQEVKEFTMRHTSLAPERFLSEVMPLIRDYTQSSTRAITDQVAAARAARIDDVDLFLSRFVGKRQVEELKLIHELEEDQPIRTLWDATNAVTALAREIPWADKRLDLERIGGEIFALAA